MPPTSKYMTNCMQIRFNLPYLLQVHKRLFKTPLIRIGKSCLCFCHYQHTYDRAYFYFFFMECENTKKNNGHIFRSGIWCSLRGIRFSFRFKQKKKMFAHLNYSPLILSCLTMTIHIEFYSHKREG